MRIVKKLAAIVLALGMLLSFVCCASADGDDLHSGFVEVKSTGDPERWLVCSYDCVYYVLDIADQSLTSLGEWSLIWDFSDGLALVKGNNGVISTFPEK